MNLKCPAVWIYLIAIHVLVVALVGALVLAVQMIREDRRLPGSRLSATYTNNDDDWWHYILHDDRDPVAAVHDRYFGVDHIMVAPPESSFVWLWSRDEGEPWELIITEYSDASAANRHLKNENIVRVLVDGGTDSSIDGFPDREAVFDGGERVRYDLQRPERIPIDRRQSDEEP